MDIIEFVSGTHRVFKEYLVDNNGDPIDCAIVQNVEFMLSRYGESECQCRKALNDAGGYITLNEKFVSVKLDLQDTKDLEGLYIARLRITDMSDRVFETEVHKILIKKRLHR